MPWAGAAQAGVAGGGHTGHSAWQLGMRQSGHYRPAAGARVASQLCQDGGHAYKGKNGVLPAVPKPPIQLDLRLKWRRIKF